MNNLKENRKIDLAKDCGWSWVVLIASFFIYTIYFGMVIAFGVYFVEFRDYFKCSRKEAAMVGSILYGGICLVGPLSNFSYRRFGSRFTVMTSGIIGTIGYVLTYFSRSIFSVAIAQGITGIVFENFLFFNNFN